MSVEVLNKPQDVEVQHWIWFLHKLHLVSI